MRLIGPLLVALVGLSCRGAASPDPVILALGDQVIRRSDFENHLNSVQARADAPLTPAVREALFEPYLEERILVLAARSRGLVGISGSAEDEQRAIQRLMEGTILANVQVTDEEVALYYAAHGPEFRTPETVTLRQILVSTENEARDVRRRLQRDPRSFEILARTRSRSPEASSGGLMGRFSRGELPPALEAAAFSVLPGNTTEMVATDLGYHLLRVDVREEARDPSLNECRGRIRSLRLRQKSDAAVRQFVRDLMSRAKVNHAAVKARLRDS